MVSRSEHEALGVFMRDVHRRSPLAGAASSGGRSWARVIRGRLPVIGLPNADFLHHGPSPAYARGRGAVGGAEPWPQVHTPASVGRSVVRGGGARGGGIGGGPVSGARRPRAGRHLLSRLRVKSRVYPLSPASLFRRDASQVESRLHQGECPPDPSRRRALTTPPFADGHDPGGLQARSSGVDCPSRGRHLFQVLGTVRGARAPLGCWSRRCPSAYALICAHGCRCSMISSRCFTLSSPRARG